MHESVNVMFRRVVNPKRERKDNSWTEFLTEAINISSFLVPSVLL